MHLCDDLGGLRRTEAASLSWVLLVPVLSKVFVPDLSSAIMTTRRLALHGPLSPLGARHLVRAPSSRWDPAPCTAGARSVALRVQYSLHATQQAEAGTCASRVPRVAT